MLEEERLDTGIHDCAGFDCGVPALNDYLRKFASQHRRRGVSQTFVLVDDSAPTEVLGYYTLSAAQLEAESLSDAERKRLPRYPIPCIRMGRLAVNRAARGRGYGRLLVGLAVERCLKARQEVAAHALVVDAKDESAVSFYLHYGFRSCRDAPQTLCLPL
ncbi:MAG: GNAT family N-acetyltransferase [Steroidobacteraceae bacterium]